MIRIAARHIGSRCLIEYICLIFIECVIYKILERYVEYQLCIPVPVVSEIYINGSV